MHSLKNQEWSKTSGSINPSLSEERATLNFNQEQLATLIWGGKDQLQRHRNLSDLFAKDPVLRNTHHYYDMTREEKMEISFAKLNRMLEVVPEDLSYTNILYFATMNLGAVRSKILTNIDG